jgi:uncharacterized protein
MTDFLKTPATEPVARLLLAHGAGAPMDSAFMTQMAAACAERGIETWRFEFPYMADRRAGGKKRPAPKADTLLDAYRQAAIAAAGPMPLLIGGKSMGGRVASMVADDLYAAGDCVGLVCLGYPFHPPNQPQTWRIAHLEKLACPALLVQGERDPFGRRAEIDGISARGELAPAIALVWIGDGDHDFGPRGASGFTRKGNLAVAADAVSAFARQR